MTAKQQVLQVQQSSVGLVAGVKAAWKVWRQPQPSPLKPARPQDLVSKRPAAETDR